MIITIAAMLVACSNDETENTGTEKDNIALFTGSIEGTHTRAYNDIWEGTDKIGISGTTGEKTYTNVPYKRDNTNKTFVVDDGKQPIYYQDDQTVTFTAYYPWDESLTAATTITADTRKQANQKKFDFLHATGTGSKGVPVDFTFKHKMAKLVLIVKAGADMTYSDVESAACSLENFLHEGSFDRTTGTATATGSTSVIWTFANNTEDETYNTPTVTKDEAKASVAYTLLLFQQSFSANNLRFTAATGGTSYSTEIDLAQVPDHDNKNELQAGAQYNITINLNKTGLTVGTSSISPWDEKSHQIDAGM
ncbi:MAG: fimbrillin family protein [Parabacteroides gordonii]|nr:fimbrillin family protein [Parabacteroides gordonii]